MLSPLVEEMSKKLTNQAKFVYIFYQANYHKEYLKMDWSSSLGNPEDLYYEALLGENEYYLLKDNRFYYENDSRIKGPYKLEKIYGKVIAIQGTCEVKGSNFINCSIPWTRFI